MASIGRLSPREQKIAFAVLAMGIVVLLYVLGVEPLLNEMKVVRKEIGEQEQGLDRLIRGQNLAQSLASRHRVEFALASPDIPVEGRRVWMQAELDAMARKVGVSVRSWSFEQSSSDIHDELIARIEISGTTWEALARFLFEMQANPEAMFDVREARNLRPRGARGTSIEAQLIIGTIFLKESASGKG